MAWLLIFAWKSSGRGYGSITYNFESGAELKYVRPVKISWNIGKKMLNFLRKLEALAIL